MCFTIVPLVIVKGQLSHLLYFPTYATKQQIGANFDPVVHRSCKRKIQQKNTLGAQIRVLSDAE